MYLNKTFKQRRWTKDSIACYLRGCVCEGCPYNSFFTDKRQKCRMKMAVIESVRVLGKPKGVCAPAILEEEKDNGKTK